LHKKNSPLFARTTAFALRPNLSRIARRDDSHLRDFWLDPACRFAESASFAVTNATLARLLRYAGMTQPDTWYVAFGPDKAVMTDDSATGAVRSTRTFKSEVEARLFAKQILAKGWTASAGTLNPQQPKQTVGASQIERWTDLGAGS
jgi:hypothetical protein